MKRAVRKSAARTKKPLPTIKPLLTFKPPVATKPPPRMRVIWFYHQDTGLFHGRTLMTSDPKMIAPNTPPGHVAIEGDHFDPVSQRVDVASGQVVDRLPPQPSVDHEWNSSARRWQIKPEIVAEEEARRVALERIRYLELKALRALREHALGQATAVDRLKSIDDEIAQLRSSLLP
jgi:hypothetical protein